MIKDFNTVVCNGNSCKKAGLRAATDGATKIVVLDAISEVGNERAFIGLQVYCEHCLSDEETEFYKDRGVLKPLSEYHANPINVAERKEAWEAYAN